MAKADNLLAILWLLRARGRMTAQELAAALETSVRTVYRYIDALCASGVPIVAEPGPDGGYRLPEAFRGAPLLFDAAELVALFHAADFARQAGHPYTPALASALAKVRRNLAPHQAAVVDRHAAAFAVADRVRAEAPEMWLRTIEEAAAEGKTLAILYHKPDAGEPERRVVDPYVLAYRGGFWYLVGFCHARQAIRDFRVDRIRDLAPTGQQFARPQGFHPNAYFSDEWVKERVQAGPVTEVHLTGEPLALARIRDHWYLRHCVVAGGQRGITLHVDPVGMCHLPAYLLTLGTSVRVRAPDGLRAQVAALAEAVVRHHRETPPVE